MSTILNVFQDQDDEVPIAWFDLGGIKLGIGAPATKPKGPAANLRELANHLRALDDAKVKARSLATVAHLLAKAGEVRAALETAESIPALSRRDFPGPCDGFYESVKPATLALIAGEQAKTGDKAGAAALFDRAEAMIHDINPGDQKLIATLVLTKARIDAGDRVTVLATIRATIDFAKAQPEPLRSRGLAMLVEAQAAAGDPAGAMLVVDAIRAYPGLEKARALGTLARRFQNDGNTATARVMARLQLECAKAKRPDGFKLGPVMNLNAFGRDTFIDPQLELAEAMVNAHHKMMALGESIPMDDPAEAERVARAKPPAGRGAALMRVAAQVAGRGDLDNALRIAASIDDPHDKLAAYQILAGGLRGAKSIAIVAPH